MDSLPATVRSPVHPSGVVPPVPIGPSGSRVAVRVLLGASVAVAVAIPAWWSHWIDSPLTGLVNLLVAGSFAATAAVLHADPEQRSTARDIGLSAVFYLASFYLASWGWAWPPQWQASPLPLLSFVGGYLWFVCPGTALARYPHSRIERRYERRFLLAFASWVCCVKAVLSASSEPGWAGFDDAAWCPASPRTAGCSTR